MFDGTLPVTFGPGIGQVDIRFDGSKIIWNLISYNSNNKTSSTTDASSNTKKCNIEDSGARLASSETDHSTTSAFDIENISGYPNPVLDMYYVSLSEMQVEAVKVNLVDIQGSI